MENKLNDYNENSIVTLKPREAISDKASECTLEIPI
jgi:hypothetical protein